ncbi:MAG TPA: type 1 glutamine amidotransferase domain-containing protein [Candidatus Limnocylindria bacterium]|nr:type 1 glutamine amidotransferase domain-containing protein [Candidatus Limnocylindria bacterium]
MRDQLNGKKIAFIAADGVEQIELERPWKAAREAGAQVELVSLKSGQIQGVHGMDKGDTFKVDRTVADVTADEYDGLVIPGGVKNPDLLRMNADAVAFTRRFFEQHKPVAAICHAPWLLVEADVVRGRTLTSYPSLKTDIRNAGGQWVDEEVHVDAGLVTSRRPDDLDAFCRKMVEEIAEGRHERQTAAAGTAGTQGTGL